MKIFQATSSTNGGEVDDVGRYNSGMSEGDYYVSAKYQGLFTEATVQVEEGLRPPNPDARKEHRLVRFHGLVELNPDRVGQDASEIGGEVLVHLSSLLGSKVVVTMEIEAKLSGGFPDHIIRTVSGNAHSLKFMIQDFERD